MPKFDAEDVEQCIIDGNDYQDCVDRMVDNMEPTTALLPEGDLIAELLTITALLGGTMERLQTSNSVGRRSKKIVIEYDVQESK
tara:strand:- start:992 stop:1243 length:252 start_codon:yes stop_codon:yes gene_type:complete